MTKRIGFGVLLGVLVVAPVSAQATACFEGIGTIAVEVTGVTGPYFSLVGEIITVNAAQQKASAPLTGSAFIRADGTVAFGLVVPGASGGVGLAGFVLTGTLYPPGYDKGTVQAQNFGGGGSQPVTLTAVACPPLPQ